MTVFALCSQTFCSHVQGFQSVKAAGSFSGGVPQLGPGNRLRCILPGPVE